MWKIANEKAAPFTLKMKLFGFWINAAVIWGKHSLSLVYFVLTVIDSKIES